MTFITVPGTVPRPADSEFSAHFIVLLLDVLERAGLPRSDTMERYGITLVQSEPVMARMRLSRVAALFDEAAAASGRPSLGFEMGSTRALGGYGLIEFTLRSAATVGEACLKLGEYIGAVNTAVHFRLEGPVLTHRPARGPGLGRHANEYTLALVLRFTQEVSGVAIRAQSVHLAHEPLAEGTPRAELERFFGTEHLETGAAVNQLVFRPEDLELPVLTHDALLHRFLHRQLKRVVEERTASDDFLERVHECLKATLADGAPSLEAVARALKMSPRTLQRRLAERERNFFTLLDELRQEQARALLLKPNLSISQVAFALGYSDLRGFERAFARWTGRAPRDWRRGNGG